MDTAKHHFTPTRHLWPAIAALAAVLLILAVTGCSNKYSQYGNDAKRTGVVNTEPADIITLPDGFSNLATKCDHGNRVYVLFHGDSGYGSVFALHDPACAQR